MGLATIIRKTKLKERQMRILILGLDGAGKSTVVAQWMSTPTLEVSPTFGFHIHTLAHPPYMLHLWDIGGQRTIRSYWRNYYEETDGLVFVVDAAAPQRLGESMSELRMLLGEDRLASASVLVLANKQDCKGALPVEEITAMVGQFKTSCRVMGCSAVTGDNVSDSLNWLIKDIATRLYHKV
ncbi:ARF-like GTPase [Paramicrosporidium saccamoebae]|uniref:ARF-like GTPase n=1 Tax=Paramicrosporidium saccamoebae TaxID=1246581 RepID=A0A2H9TG25_9FUNG|nr:ARF-like GTPase [Paramicrosporidium saccamoebae]